MVQKLYRERIGEVVRGCKILDYYILKSKKSSYTKYLVKCSSCDNTFNISAIFLFNKYYKDTPANCGCKPKYTPPKNRKRIPIASHIGKTIRSVKILDLVDTDFEGNKLKNKKFVCECRCGKIYLGQPCHLLKEVYSEMPTSCGCITYNGVPSNSREHKREYATLTYKRTYSSLKNTARKRKLEVSITFEQFVEISKKQCFYCEKITYKNAYKHIDEPMFKKTSNNDLKLRVSKDMEKDVDKYTVPCSGLDRIDSKKGYTLENILPCCTRCNIIKHTASIDEFFSHIERILTVKKQRELSEEK